MALHPRKLMPALLATALAFGAAAFAAGNVRIATSLAPASLQPAEATGLPDATVIRTMFEGLVGFLDGQLVTELASDWQANADATSYTFTLREGVKFHDGTPFDAAAVKAYYEWVLDPNSRGARGRSQLKDVKDIVVLGDHELRIDLKQANGAFIYLLAISNSRIASPASIEKYGDDISRNPVGTGPFKLVSWTEGQSVIVERNPDYWGDAAKVDRLEFVVVTNAATRVAMLQSGEVQFIEALPPQLVPVIQADPKLEVASTKTNFLRVLELNTTRKPFDDVRVRQALNYAIDKEQLVRVAVAGLATVMTSPIPETTFGAAPQPPYGYDPEKARSLLADAGYPNGFDVKVLTFTGDEYRTVGQVLQQMFAQVGVRMTLDQQERGALVDQIFKPQDENPTEAALVGASASTGDADLAITTSFVRASFPPASNNWSFYSNDEVEKDVLAARETGDQEQRAKLYADALGVIWQDAPWVFLYSPDSVAGRSASLSGVAYAPDNTVDARRAELR